MLFHECNVALPVESGEGPQVGSVPRIVQRIARGTLVAADLQPVLLLLGAHTEILVLCVPLRSNDTHG